MSIDAWAQVAIFTHFYLYMDPVWSLLIVGTCFVHWVELLVQRRLCPIFMSGVGLLDIHEYSTG